MARKMGFCGRDGSGLSDLRSGVEVDQFFDYPMQIFNSSIERRT